MLPLRHAVRRDKKMILRYAASPLRKMPAFLMSCRRYYDCRHAAATRLRFSLFTIDAERCLQICRRCSWQARSPPMILSRGDAADSRYAIIYATAIYYCCARHAIQRARLLVTCRYAAFEALRAFASAYADYIASLLMFLIFAAIVYDCFTFSPYYRHATMLLPCRRRFRRFDAATLRFAAMLMPISPPAKNIQYIHII